MDENSTQKDSQYLWETYERTIDAWQNSYKHWQDKGKEAFKIYLKGYQQALKNSNIQDMSKYNELWEKTMQNLHETPYSVYQKAWNDVWMESGFTSFKAFSDYWGKSWKDFSQETIKQSEEALKRIEKSLDSGKK